MRTRTIISALLLIVGLTYASDTVTSYATLLATQICSIRYLVYDLLPTIALVLFLLSGLVYAAGQAFGAETKTRAQGWAMSLLVGGIIGVIIIVLAPALLSVFISGTPLEAWNTCI